MIGEFQFVDFLVTNIDYKAVSLDDGDEQGENNIEFAYNLQHDEKVYTLGLLVVVENIQKDHKLKIRLETKGKFVFNDDTALDDAKCEELIKVNGSAILFPYIRSLLYNLTSADSHGDAIILPTINFTKVIEEIDKSKTENKDTSNN